MVLAAYSIGSTKSIIAYVFIVLLTNHHHLIVQYIICFFAATANSTAGGHFCPLLEYVLHHPERK